ncbi:hypothetical protein [Myxococcus stipitatus]|uniref:hypothetical protein n=1 Tax=Myxococcus stipitatus TaxID=83455 RepID=UPI0030CDD6CA
MMHCHVWGFNERQRCGCLARRPSVLEARRPGFVSRKFSTACLVTEELYVDQVPDRDEFRALCDKHFTRDAIVSSLRG